MMWSTITWSLLLFALSASTVLGQHQAVNSRDHPWVAAIFGFVEKVPIGTGLIMSRRWVLTPAHFWISKRFTDRNAAVEYGATNTLKGEGKIGKIMATHIHPHFHSLDTDAAFDVAVLQMRPTLELDWYHGELFPIDAENSLRPAGEVCSVTGFGVEYHEQADDFKPRMLRTMEVEIQDTNRCMAKMPFSKEMLCAGPRVGASLCPGYEGAMMKCGEKFYGMFVKSEACPSSDDRVNVYLRLGTMRDFIIHVVVAN